MAKRRRRGFDADLAAFHAQALGLKEFPPPTHGFRWEFPAKGLPSEVRNVGRPPKGRKAKGVTKSRRPHSANYLRARIRSLNALRLAGEASPTEQQIFVHMAREAGLRSSPRIQIFVNAQYVASSRFRARYGASLAEQQKLWDWLWNVDPGEMSQRAKNLQEDNPSE
jgi:hypothetical protein